MTDENSKHPVAVVILAAGKGTRMRSDNAKVLHKIAGQPMLHLAMRAAMTLDPAHLAVVVGHCAEEVAASARQVAPGCVICPQEEQLGTGHAVNMAREALAGFEGQMVVLFGDTPFIRPETLASLVAEPQTLTVLGFETARPGRYGRLVIADGALERIVEAKDASPAELEITACNSGVMAGPAGAMFDLLEALSPENAQGEYYLTDLVALGRRSGLPTRAVFCDQSETLGINDRADLAAAEAAFQQQARIAAMAGGTTLVAPETVHLAWDTKLGRDVVVEPNVVFGPGVTVHDGATIRAFCHLTECEIAPDVSIGPFARLRGGARIGQGAQIGNFVEMKNVEFGAGAKAAHLTYVGDASVGEKANLGAGTITCNYDGVNKHRTEIGERAFIGSNTMLIAPVRVGDDAYTATGTVVTKDVPGGDLAIARARQENKTGFGRKLRERLTAMKKNKG
ncbi:bifunctional UDP-N-acetylglucosamine diphosphorylase/glucosamine-1-phosphate N-acetyltransferase GlmU [Rhodobacteraceae bacterium NNCM2]|nr:bifunctional UDP-N-acetylglucosamine diphosphorylase/glucosamine-1-phosphate N-acetyltransferase GlmU [Coraliihabitans acroporae]